MKTGLILSLVLLIAATGFGIYAEYAVTAQSDRYISAAHELLTLTQSGDWPRATEVAESYHHQLEQTDDWLCILINHEEVEQLSSALTDVRSSILTQTLIESARSCYQLEAAAQKIRDRNTLSIQNIL